MSRDHLVLDLIVPRYYEAVAAVAELQSGCHLELRLWRDHEHRDKHAVAVFRKNERLGHVCHEAVARALDGGVPLQVMITKAAVAGPGQKWLVSPPKIHISRRGTPLPQTSWIEDDKARSGEPEKEKAATRAT